MILNVRADLTPTANDLASSITRAYAAETKPPLTQELTERLRTALRAALDPLPGEEPVPEPLDRLNAALDGFESELRSVVGPRIASLDDATGSVVMKQRSEAGQPFRAFGGQ